MMYFRNHMTVVERLHMAVLYAESRGWETRQLTLHPKHMFHHSIQAESDKLYTAVGLIILKVKQRKGVIAKEVLK